MNRLLLIVAAALAALPTVAAAAQNSPQARQRPELFEALVRCRSITDGAARLQCFDTAAAALQQAAERRDVVVVDRAQVRENRRRLFGLPIPGLSDIFGGGGGEDDEDEVNHIESTVASAQQGGTGRWVVTLADGSTWIQTDDLVVAGRPRRGQRVRVERAALGSYRMRINNQPAIRVRRQL